MCTYLTAQAEASGSGKGADGWFPLRTTTVYFDHPVHAQADHTLNIDFANPERGPGQRVAVELTAQAAVDLVRTVSGVLAQVPADLTGLSASELAALSSAVTALGGTDAPARSNA